METCFGSGLGSGSASVSCAVCLDRVPSTAFVPCGHIAVCATCDCDGKTRAVTCPLCRAAISERAELHVEADGSVQHGRARLLLQRLLHDAVYWDLRQVCGAEVGVGGLGLDPLQRTVGVVELFKFLVLRVLADDLAGTRLSPSPAVDLVWHSALLRPVTYARLCGLLLHGSGHAPGTLLDHVLPIAEAGLPERLQQARANYEAVFGPRAIATAAFDSWWGTGSGSTGSGSTGSGGAAATAADPTFTLLVAQQDCFECSLTLTRPPFERWGQVWGEGGPTVADIKVAIKEAHTAMGRFYPWPVDQMRVIFNGRQWDDKATLGDMGLKEKAMGASTGAAPAPRIHVVLRLRGC